ncbi:hypothetical protein AB0J35_43765 [Nonomuraea angiospora]|uniref:hypothetical protein n=1 Tax=Nonomuraea angiospora TaxID=46172 RepID=UPI003437F0DD
MPEEADRRALVWMNALSVSRPDYRIVHEEQLLAKRHAETSDFVSVVVEPRWPGGSSMEVYGRQDLSIHSLSDGFVESPYLRSWRVTDALQALRDKPNHAKIKAQTTALAKKLGGIEELRATIVVGFANPLTEEDVERISSRVPDVALLSPPRSDSRLPISWDYSGYCNARGFDDCNPDIRTSLTSGFRKWVSLLDSDDANALQSFDLNLSELRNSARQGLWYGAVYNAHIELVAELAADPRVSVILVGQVALGQ